jgi:hypothetical protein
VLAFIDVREDGYCIFYLINSIINNNAFGFFRPCKALRQRQYSFSIVIYILGFKLFSRLLMGEHQIGGYASQAQGK